MEVIRLEKITKVYPTPAGDVTALRELDLSVEEGTFMAIMGRSGSGKTTLLKILGTLLAPTSGSYRLNGREVSELSEKERCALRRRGIGFVFQRYRLLREYSVWENICMPLCLDGVRPDEEYLRDLAERCGIGEKLAMYPDQLSGGEQQRVAIVRAMSHKPSILLADEPTGNLDYRTGQAVMEVLADCRREFRQTVLLVTHDNGSASYADEIRVMADGQWAVK